MDLLGDCLQADEFTISERQPHSFARSLGYLEGVLDANQLVSGLKGTRRRRRKNVTLSGVLMRCGDLGQAVDAIRQIEGGCP